MLTEFNSVIHDSTHIKKGYSYMYKTHTCAHYLWQLQTIPNYGIIKKCPFSFLMSMNLGYLALSNKDFFRSLKHLANILITAICLLFPGVRFHLWDTRWRPRTAEASLRSTWTATTWTPWPRSTGRIWTPWSSFRGSASGLCGTGKPSGT